MREGSGWYWLSLGLSMKILFKRRLTDKGVNLPSRLWRSGGFTLLELILVLAIVALGASMAAPAITSGIKGAKLRTTCRKAGALMHRARSNAAAFKQTMVAYIDRESQSLVVRPFAGQQEDKGQEPARQSSISYQLPEGIRIEAVWIGEEESKEKEARCAIFFYPDGKSTGGRILFQDDRGRSLNLLVHRITGAAEIREPQEGELR
jgi:general secretion pathway protein H